MDAEDDPRYGQSHARRYYGKYAGLVTDDGPPSDGSAHRGQVKVQVPGILEETPDRQDQQPIEVLAYPAFLPGFFFVPKNEDPVWVEFVAGDINYPIWTGVWYPDDAAPKATDPGQPTQAGEAPTLDQKIIRTASGQVIQLDDTSGSEQLVIKDETNGNTITLDSKGIKVEDANNNTVTLDSNGIKVEDSNSNTVTMDADGIKGEATASGGSVTFTFGQATVVIKDGSISLKAGDSSSITIDANSGITLKCGTDNQISVGSSQLTLKTSAVNVKIDNTAMDVS